MDGLSSAIYFVPQIALFEYRGCTMAGLGYACEDFKQGAEIWIILVILQKCVNMTIVFSSVCLVAQNEFICQLTLVRKHLQIIPKI